MGPTSEFVRRVAGLQARAVDRPTKFAPTSRSETAPAGRVPQAVRRAAWISWAKSVIQLRLVFLLVGFWCFPLGGASDPYSSEFEMSLPKPDLFEQGRNQRAASEQQERFRLRIPIPEAVGDDVQPAFSASRQAGLAARTQRLAALPESHRQNLLVAAGFLLAGALAFLKLAPGFGDYLNQHFNPWVLAPSTAANFSAKVRAEDEAFSEFLAVFRNGPSVMPAAAPSALNSSSACDPLHEFLARAPNHLGELRKLLREIGAATSQAARRKMLADLHRELRVLKGEAGLSELLPVWQLAAAVEGLVKQLIDKAGNVTPSTLRTVRGGVDLLVDLSVPGLRADLLTPPPSGFWQWTMT